MLVAPNAIGSGLEPCVRKSLLGSNKKQHQVRVSPQPSKNFRSPRPNATDFPPFLEAKVSNTLNNIPGASDTDDGTLLKTAEFPSKQYTVVSPPRRRCSDEAEDLGSRVNKVAPIQVPADPEGQKPPSVLLREQETA